MFSCLLCERQSHLAYSYTLRIFQNAFCSKISSDSLVAIERKEVEQLRSLLKNDIKQEKVGQLQSLFRNYGLSDTQLSKVRPVVYKCDPHKNILPKLEFFRSLGASTDDFQNIILKNPSLLMRSLQNNVIPVYNFLKSISISNREIVKLMRFSARLFGTNVEKIVANVNALKAMGVPHSSIMLVAIHYPSLVTLNTDKLKEGIDEVFKMGFIPSKTVFVQAILARCSFSKEGWESRKKVYTRFGLSESDIQLAFRAHPLCMSLSEGKIERAMDFFVNEMGFPVSMIVLAPAALFYNFEKRIVPRCRVIKVLEGKGLLKKPSLMTFLAKTDEQFLVNYVLKYKDVLPKELKRLYSDGLISRWS